MGAMDNEEQYYQDEVKQIKQWWTDSRWRFTKRPYTAEQIASKRGNLPIEYPSNAMAKKLWKTVEQRFAVCYLGLFVPSVANRHNRAKKLVRPLAASTLS